VFVAIYSFVHTFIFAAGGGLSKGVNREILVGHVTIISKYVTSISEIIF
jgi:hypothetical protein